METEEDFDMMQLTLLALVLGQTSPITVTAPTASSDVVVGTTFNIQWTSGSITDVKLQLTTDDGTSWSTIADTVDSLDSGWQDYPWQVPDEPSVTCRIRVSDYNAPGTYGDSETFEIRRPATGAEDEGGCAAVSGSAVGVLFAALAFWRRRR
jgi:hypothetical protein